MSLCRPPNTNGIFHKRSGLTDLVPRTKRGLGDDTKEAGANRATFEFGAGTHVPGLYHHCDEEGLPLLLR